MARIRFDGVTKRYGPVTAVDRLDLEIHDREFVVLLGPSGCGKTTTLNIVAGLEELSEGDLYFDDLIVNFMPPHRRDVAMVFQSYALYPHKTVYENIAFGLRMRGGQDRDEIDRRVRDAALRLHIGHLLERKPHQLSGGQRQRVALGRAMVRQPAVFLMDEPLSNLDAALRISMRAEIKQLHQVMQTTFVYVTHDQAEALTLADRIVVMRDGVIQQVGDPAAIYERPRNTFVASFLGSPPINYLEGRLSEEAGRLVFRRGDFAVELAAETGAAAPADGGRVVVLGVRPEDVVERPAGAAAPIRGRIDSVLPIGSDEYLGVRVEGVDCFFRVGKEVQHRAGEAVALELHTRRVHLFDPQTGEALLRRPDGESP
ncbi:MAG: ABC transporter ATP-binding protein [Geminicoccaceae bacterium]